MGTKNETMVDIKPILTDRCNGYETIDGNPWFTLLVSAPGRIAAGSISAIPQRWRWPWDAWGPDGGFAELGGAQNGLFHGKFD